jgi:hypothetical protein
MAGRERLSHQLLAGAAGWSEDNYLHGRLIRNDLRFLSSPRE